MIYESIKEIEEKFSVQRISTIGPFITNSDIDFFVRNENEIDALHKYLDSKGFIVQKTAYNVCAFIYFENKLYFLDFIVSIDTLLHRYSQASFKKEFTSAYHKDQSLFRFIKYVYAMRGYGKYITFVEDNYDQYARYLTDATFIDRPVFRTGATKSEILGFMRRQPLSIYRALTMRAFGRFCLTYLTERIKKVNSGKSIAFVGVDGAGKTTVIEELNSFLGNRVVYMGDYYFTFQNFYNWLGAKHLFLARLSFVLQLFEQYMRWLRIKLLNIRGLNVICDRYPGFNRPLRKQGKLLKINSLLYSWFPQPTAIILLAGDPKVIYKRRQEMSKVEIKIYQDNARLFLKKFKNSFIVENQKINNTLNTVLCIYFRIHK